MKKILICLTFLYFGSYLVLAQDIKPKSNTFFFEFGGISLNPYSINYDRILFTTKKDYFNTTIGFGFHKKIENDEYFSFPVSINYTTGLYKKNHLELGVCATYLNKKDRFSSNKSVYGGLRINYKYQSKNSLFFKTGINFFTKIHSYKDDRGGLFKDLELVFNMVNLSVGYNF